MSGFLRIFVVVFAGIFIMPTWTAHAADTDVSDDWPFNVETGSMASGASFTFNISAAGTFSVDCGDDGVLTADNLTITDNTTFTKSDTTNIAVSCTYSTAGTHLIRLGGG